MKNNFKILFAAIVLLMTFSCKKETNPFFANGHAVTLTTSSPSAIAPTAADSLNKVLFLSWTNPAYSTDSAHQKFLVQLDSSGRGFKDAVSFEVDGPLIDSFTAEQINNTLLGWGFAFNTAYSIDVRVLSSYTNNNEQYASNTITFTFTTYKTPPKIPVPDSLFIVGGATPGGWNNPVPMPSQQMTQIDSVTFGCVLYLSTGNGGYDLLPVNGSWNNKYNLADASVPGAGVSGSFQASTGPGGDFPAPATAGYYTMIFNFQSGTYTVSPNVGPSLPDSLASYAAGIGLTTGLWIIGDATPETNQWDNDPVALANQQFTRLSNSDYQLTVELNNTGGYLFLPVAGSWSNKYASNVTPLPLSGMFVFNGNNNFPAPTNAGNYLIDVNFLTSIYTLTPQ